MFVLSDEDQEAGYTFPDVLDEAGEVHEDNEAMGKDLAIIADNIRLMRHQSNFAGVSLKTLILPAPQQEKHSWLEKLTWCLFQKIRWIRRCYSQTLQNKNRPRSGHSNH